MSSTATQFTYDQYEAMIARGAFEPRERHRVELIRGEILPKDPRGPMSPIDPPHNNAVDLLTEWSFEVLPRDFARVRVQGSLGIPALESIPEPDLAWLVRKDYARAHPTPEDVLLLVEVSDSSLRKDRLLKAALYAEAGIRDYWIVNIPERCIEVHREPAGSSYGEVVTLRSGEGALPLVLPGAALAVDRIFPGTEPE